MTLVRHNNQKGLTLIGLLVAIVIIAILATIAISITLSMREKLHVRTLRSDLSKAYKSAVSYHSDNPDDEVDEEKLKEYGYEKSEKVILKIEDGSAEGLKITARHPGVRGAYYVDRTGSITKE